MGYNTLITDVVISDYQSAVKTIGTSQTLAAVGVANLSNRQELMIYNDSLSTIFYGPSGVTTTGSTKGISIYPGGFVNLPFGPGVEVYLIAGTAGNSVIVQELG